MERYIYRPIIGDSAASIDDAFEALLIYGVSDYQAGALREACTFGTNYSRNVRDNIDRALWALAKGEVDTAIHWYEVANRCL